MVTFTKNVKSGKKTVTKTAQILWKVVANDAPLSLGFNTSGGVIEGGLVGLKYGDLLAFSATANATVKASGLPKGIALVKLGDGNYAFVGYTAKAGTYLVTVTATLNGKSVTQRIALKVDGLPSWAKGTYNGYVAGADGATNGLATLSVKSDGKISGKFYEGGTNWALNAACYTGTDAEGTEFTCSNVVAKYTYKATEKVKGKKKTVTKSVTRAFELAVSAPTGSAPYQGGVAALAERRDGVIAPYQTVEAWQNLWGSAYKVVGVRLFYTSSKKPYRTFAIKGGTAEGDAIGLTDRMTLSLKVTSTGAVTATLTYDTGKKDKKTKKTVYYKPMCSTVVIPTSAADAEAFTGDIFLYFAPSAANGFDGYAGCAEVRQ